MKQLLISYEDITLLPSREDPHLWAVSELDVLGDTVCMMELLLHMPLQKQTQVEEAEAETEAEREEHKQRHAQRGITQRILKQRQRQKQRQNERNRDRGRNRGSTRQRHPLWVHEMTMKNMSKLLLFSKVQVFITLALPYFRSHYSKIILTSFIGIIWHSSLRILCAPSG